MTVLPLQYSYQLLFTDYILLKHISKSGPMNIITFSDSFWEHFKSEKCIKHKKTKYSSAET